jgi:hypothetical protein
MVGGETMKVLVWNMRHRPENWEALRALQPDLALLCEASPAPDGIKAVARGATTGRDGYFRPWSTAVISAYGVPERRARGRSWPREVLDARASRYGRPLKLPFVSSRPGSWTAARVWINGPEPVTAISLYGLMDEKSDASVHRSLSELAPVFEDPKYNRLLLLAGDLNTWTGWRRGSHLDRDRCVLA